MKVLERRDAVNGSFEDPAVQAEIRRALDQNVIHILRQEAIERSRDRTYIWPAGIR
jgi:hypothetical protein